MKFSEEFINYLETFGIVLIIGISFVMLFLTLRRVLAVKNKLSENFNLNNLGNVVSTYFFTIESEEPYLEFDLIQDGSPLAEIPYPESEPEKELIVESEAPEKTKKESKVPKVSSGKAIKAGRGIATRAGAIASVLGLLGNILPGAVGATLKGQANTARNVQADALKALQTPETAKRKVSALKSGSSKAGLKTSKQNKVAGAIEKQVKLQHSSQKGKDKIPSNTEIVPIAIRPKTPSYLKAQSAEIYPGESISFTLNVDTTANKYPENRILYSIESLQTPFDLNNQKLLPVIRKREMTFDQVEKWRYWITPLSILIVLVVAVWITKYSLTLIWQ